MGFQNPREISIPQHLKFDAPSNPVTSKVGKGYKLSFKLNFVFILAY